MTRWRELRGGRLFFPLALLMGALWIPLWALRYWGALEFPSHFPGAEWHAHEMIFGYLAAVIAGFATVGDRGPRILVLAALWIGGRALLLANAPPTLSAAVDLAFLPMLLVLRRPRLWAGHKMMTLGIAAVLLGLTLANAWMHVAAMQGEAHRAGATAAALIVLLLVIVGGRLTPGHTRAATRRGPGLRLTGLERVSIALGGLLIAATAAGLELAAAACAVILGGLQAVRLWRWRDRAVLADPLLWGLHLGFGWLALGLLLLGATGFGWAAPADALHVILVGGAGTLTLAIMMRLIQAQNGLPQRGASGEALVLSLVSAATVLRGCLPLLSPAWRPEAGGLAAVVWSAALFAALALYAPLLVRGRKAR